MHLDRGLLGWGVFLLTLGGLVLALRAGMLPDEIRWLELWPLALIGWGLGLLLSRTPYAALGTVVVSVTFGLIVGGIAATGAGFAFGCGDDGGGQPFADARGSLAGGSVEIEQACGNLDVSMIGGTEWTVAGRTTTGDAPEIDATADRLSLSSQDKSFVGFWEDRRTDWQVGLPTGGRLDMSVTVSAGQARMALAGADLDSFSGTFNASDARIDLTEARLGSLSVTTNAANVAITLPTASFSGSVTANAGNVSLCAPAGVGVRISASTTLGANNFEERQLVETGDGWETPGYAAAPEKIVLSTTANVGNVAFNPDEGCE